MPQLRNLRIATPMHFDERQRPDWEIDRRLKSLLGFNVRVRAEAFAIPKWDGTTAGLIPAGTLILPDNSLVHRDELYFEGQLASFRRNVALVSVLLNRLALEGEVANGRVLFRGRPAVILQAPALVQLSDDHFIEKLPSDFNFYWSHLGAAGPQPELPLD